MNNPNISIVTAYFDIGRGEWEGWMNGHPLPGYLKRTNDEYFQRFERLLKLENEIILFTERKFSPYVKLYQRKKKNLKPIYLDDWTKLSDHNLLERISRVQCNHDFLSMIKQPWNPEYWSPEYILVNFLKSNFVNYAIDNGHVSSELVAWIDFGYCRDDNTVPSKVWNYDFDPKKIHLFTLKNEIDIRPDFNKIIATNDVTMMGCHIVAGLNGWEHLQTLMYENLQSLLFDNMIDDDQTLLYMSYLDAQHLFEIHHINENDGGWFQILRRFNNAKS